MKIRTLQRPLVSVLAAIIVLISVISIPPDCFAESNKRIAVLYFNDHSRFDSPTGCGCIPGIIGKFFGTRQKWNIKAGFTQLLNRKLKQTPVYEPVSREEIEKAIVRLGLTKKDLESDAQKRRILLRELKANALVIGDIRSFGQQRARANASRTLREGSREQGRSGSYIGGVQVLGYTYTARTKLNMEFFGMSGDKIAAPKIAAMTKHQLGGAQIAAIRTVVTDEGTELGFGQTQDKRRARPILEPAKLNQIQFPSEDLSNYDRTLLGMASDEAMDKIVLALREHIGPNFVWPPAPATTAENKPTRPTRSFASGPILGKISYVNAESPKETYINIGSAKGLAIGHRLTVYRETEPIKDPDTGQILGYIHKPVGKAEVIEVRNDKMARIHIIEGFGEVKMGDGVKVDASATPAPGGTK